MFEDLKIRCSGIKHVMTEPKTKKAKEAGELSVSVKTHLSDLFVSHVYGRNTNIENKYTIKGHMVEEDSLTLYTRYKKQGILYKNEEHFNNDYIQGTPDIIKGDTIIDIKSSWDIFTFFRNKDAASINSMYYWQLQGYMALTGANKAVIAYCLVDTPPTLREDEKRRLFFKMNAATTEDKDYQLACEELDSKMVYDDIPLTEKVIEVSIDRNDSDIDRIYKRVVECREYMESTYGSHTIIAHGDKIGDTDVTIVSRA